MNRRTWMALGLALVLAAATWWVSQLPAVGGGPPAAAPAQSATDLQTRTVRVLLRGDARTSWPLRIDGPYRVTAADHWRVLAQGSRLDPYEVVANEEGIRIGDHTFAEPEIYIDVGKSGSLWVGDRRYRGDLKIVRKTGDRLAAINVVPLESYVASVVAGEMPDSFPPAARQAQAILARSYVLYQMRTFGQASQFDVYDSPRSQNYQGMEARQPSGEVWKIETDSARQATELTASVVCTFRGQLFCTFYHAVCGGATLNGHEVFPGAAPPLVSVPCEGCAPGPHYRWEKTLSQAELSRRLDEYLRPRGRTLGKLLDVQMDDEGNPGSGSPSKFRLLGEEQTLTATGVELQFRMLSGVPRSPTFRIERDGDNYHFQGRGWGHGVGMCQWGARQKALDGHDCVAILKYYLPGCDFTVIQ